MALKKSKCIIALAISSFLFFAACDDDSSSSPVAPSDSEVSSSSIALANSSSSVMSSSSVIPGADPESSSSIALANSSSSVMSSSSVIPGADPESSSSIALAKSSSSVFSSSSWTLSSSDSRETGTIESSSSSYSIELNCSALLEGESGWSRDVPKECRFNPDITYGTMTDTRDKKVYKTIKIGDQTWMAENLNYADSVTTKSLQNRSWCYNNVAANCAVAGRLYTWGAAIDSVKLATDADNPQDCGYGMTCTLPAKVQGICPEGWHLPTNAEWETLFTEVGGSSTAGKIFKSQTGWCNNGNGTDGVGFSALPVGYRHNKGWFYYDCNDAYFWSATELDAINAYRMDLTYHYEFAHLYYSLKNVGFSVRCLQD